MKREGFLLIRRLEMRDGVSALLCLRWLINHDTSLLGENTNHTKSSSLSHPSSLCVQRLCVLTCNYTRWDATPFMQTCPRGWRGGGYRLSGPIDPSSLPRPPPPSRLFMVPPTNEPPCYAPPPRSSLPFIPPAAAFCLLYLSLSCIAS